MLHNNQLIGVLNIESTQRAAFSGANQSPLLIFGSLMADALSATFSRRNKLDRARIEAASVALTQLGNMAQSFLHRFGNIVGDARGKLIELKAALSCVPGTSLRGGSIDAADFVSGIISNLSEAAQAMVEFSDRFDPSHPQFQLRKVDLEAVTRTALVRTQIGRASCRERV